MLQVLEGLVLSVEGEEVGLAPEHPEEEGEVLAAEEVQAERAEDQVTQIEADLHQELPKINNQLSHNKLNLSHPPLPDIQPHLRLEGEESR